MWNLDLEVIVHLRTLSNFYQVQDIYFGLLIFIFIINLMGKSETPIGRTVIRDSGRKETSQQLGSRLGRGRPRFRLTVLGSSSITRVLSKVEGWAGSSLGRKRCKWSPQGSTRLSLRGQGEGQDGLGLAR